MITFAPFLREWHQRSFRAQFYVTLALLLPVLFLLTRFLDAIETRPGVTLPDPVLALFEPINLTWLTFLIIYLGLIMGILILLRHPQQLLLAMQTYTVMALIRMAAMYLTPLDPPPGMIALKDPFVEYFGGGTTLTRDLFFSGHTSTLFILSLAVPERSVKTVYVAGMAIVALCVILQHVHYGIDVLAALFFAFGSYRIVCTVRGLLLKQPKAGDTM